MSATDDLLKSVAQPNKQPVSATDRLLLEPRVLPRPVTPPVVEQPKTKLQKAGAIAGSLAIDIAKPFIKSYELLTQGAKTYGQVFKAGGQALTGDMTEARATLDTEAARLEKERAKPIVVKGKEIERVKTMRQAIGTGLEVLSYGIGGGEALAAKNIIKQTLNEGLKVGARQVAKRLAIGGAAMSIYETGTGLQEDKTAKEIAINAVKGFGIGATFEVGMLGLGAGGALAARKFQNVIKGLRPTSIEEKLAAEAGEKMMPARVKIGEEIKNASDNKISYQKELSLGKDASGQPVLSRTEINPKTGEAKIFLDKSLDKTPGRKALIIEKAHNDIINLRTTPVAAKSETALEKSLEDFGLRIGKTKEEVGAILEKESKPFGGLQGAIKEYSANPVVVKEKAPTIASLLEHQTDPNVNILTTSAHDLAQKELKKVEQKILDIRTPKVEEPKPTGDLVTPRATQRLESLAVEKKLLNSLDDLPEREVNHIKDQAAEYANIALNRELSERVAMGLEDAPGKLKASYVWVQEANRAAREGNVEMIQKLANSPLVKQFSEEGSSIRMLREMDHANPVSVIKRVNQAKVKKFVDTGKVKKMTQELKEVVRKSGPSKETWSSFIDSIKC